MTYSISSAQEFLDSILATEISNFPKTPDSERPIRIFAQILKQILEQEVVGISVGMSLIEAIWMEKNQSWIL